MTTDQADHPNTPPLRLLKFPAPPATDGSHTTTDERPDRSAPSRMFFAKAKVLCLAWPEAAGVLEGAIDELLEKLE